VVTTSDGDNDLTGSVCDTVSTVDGVTNTETGSDVAEGGSYTINETDSSSNTQTTTGNELTGLVTVTSTASSNSSLQETGSTTDGSFSLTETVITGQSQVQTLNALSGAYTSTGGDNTTTTIQESNSTATGGDSYTETIADSASDQGSGNTLSGDYSQTRIGGTTTTFTDSGSNASGSFSVNSGDTNTYTQQNDGNNFSGSYTQTTTATDVYNSTETNSVSTDEYFTLQENGTVTSTTTETGNTLDGSYSRTQQGSDSYSMTETGAHPAGSFDETVTGVDTFTLTESGNTPNQTFTQTISGGGSYMLTDSGAGATLTGGSGSYNYSTTETGDDRSGDLSQSETGSDRYGLLESFNNVSNSQSGNSPGHLNFSPIGTPFADPGPGIWDTLGHVASNTWKGVSDAATEFSGIVHDGISSAVSIASAVPYSVGLTDSYYQVTPRSEWGASVMARSKAAYAAEKERRNGEAPGLWWEFQWGIRDAISHSNALDTFYVPPAFLILRSLNGVDKECQAQGDSGPFWQFVGQSLFYYLLCKGGSKFVVEPAWTLAAEDALGTAPAAETTPVPQTATPANSPLLQRYLSESGGRWGGTATRQLNHRLATDLESRGFQVTGGAGRAAEEWIPGPGGGARGGTWVDVTATNSTQTIRIQTVTTLPDGVTLAPAEAAAAARIRAAFPNDQLILVSKQTGQVIP
jgi:hypothetical protein